MAWKAWNGPIFIPQAWHNSIISNPRHMLILLTIFLFIFIPILMLIFHLVRPRFSIQGFLAVLAGLAGWIMVFIGRGNNPQIITLLRWQPDNLFPVSPTMYIDDISWYFSLALASLSITVLLTSITQLGGSNNSEEAQAKDPHLVDKNRIPAAQDDSPSMLITSSYGDVNPNWQVWASMLILTSMGLVAVTAGNLLCLLLAWAALDLLELIILLLQVTQSSLRERIILAFSAKLSGIGILLIAVLISWSQNASLNYDSLPITISPLLVLAAGFRLGVLPLHIPLVHRLPINRHLGTLIRLVPAAASYILLVRVANIGIAGKITPYLLAFTVVAGVYGGVKWLISHNELEGRPFWLLGTASLSIASAVLNQPISCLAWALASLLCGGFIFSIPFRHQKLVPLFALGLFNFSALPFSPTWQGVTLFKYASNHSMDPFLFYFFAFFLIISQSFLLAGLIQHTLSGFYPDQNQKNPRVERWVWFLYPIGLLFTLASHMLLGVSIYPNLVQVPLFDWVTGPLVVIITGFIYYFSWHNRRSFESTTNSGMINLWNDLISLEWLYRYLWKIFRSIARLFTLISRVLEGEGGIIWALVLFALIFVLIQR
jgi:hypothetical protein